MLALENVLVKLSLDFVFLRSILVILHTRQIHLIYITKWHYYFRETVFFMEILLLNNVAFDIRKVTLTSLEVSRCITYTPSSFKLNTHLP